MATVPQGTTAAPTIHEATLASGPSGAVEWGAVLTFDEAVARRKSGEDAVIRGGELKANRNLARQVEAAVGVPSKPQFPHTSGAGSHALPHFHQDNRDPRGHTFYETDKRKARKKA